MSVSSSKPSARTGSRVPSSAKRYICNVICDTASFTPCTAPSAASAVAISLSATASCAPVASSLAFTANSCLCRPSSFSLLWVAAAEVPATFKMAAAVADCWAATLSPAALVETPALARACLALRMALCWSVISCRRGAMYARMPSSRALRAWQSTTASSVVRNLSASISRFLCSSWDAAPTWNPALAADSRCAEDPKDRQSSAQSLSAEPPWDNSSLQTPVMNEP
mmetsp:Transcript_53587/g.152710  ORF Transcript_53587/g.152710 Transcript_53587/m.152710 type:complete len:226 (-) Transcript_53587:607-1284(-)